MWAILQSRVDKTHQLGSPKSQHVIHCVHGLQAYMVALGI
jgi:hypothetical protein